MTEFEDTLYDLFTGIEDQSINVFNDFNFENCSGSSDGETSSSCTDSSSMMYPLPPNSSSVMMPCYDLDSNSLYLHTDMPLLSKSNKRIKRDADEIRLIKNRESANRSRMKRKNEKLEMEETIAELKSRIRTLELENTALLTDNASLHNQNLYLRTLLSERDVDMKKKSTSTAPSLNGTVSGITVLCVVCMCTIFNDWLPPALRITQSLSSNTNTLHRPSGRVLLSMQDIPSIHMTSHYTDAIESSPQSYIRMGLLLLVILCYFGYHQYMQRNKLQKNGWLLP